jgi:hypothetical protein
MVHRLPQGLRDLLKMERLKTPERQPDDADPAHDPCNADTGAPDTEPETRGPSRETPPKYLPRPTRR